MNLRADDTLEETPTAVAGVAGTVETDPAPATSRATHTHDAPLPVLPERDFIQLLLQSPHKLYLYWTFARDPHVTLHEAFGELAAQYRLVVRLIKVESGEEFLLEASSERAQWLEVYPHHVYRAEVGFHAANRPFVRLLSSNTVSTPPDRASHLSDKEQEFRVGAGEFARLLCGASYERYARGLADDASAPRIDDQGGASPTVERQGAGGSVSREGADEYPHR